MTYYSMEEWVVQAAEHGDCAWCEAMAALLVASAFAALMWLLSCV